MSSSMDRLDRRIEAAAGDTSDDTSRSERKAIIKEALREVMNDWLDERLRDVGKWSLRGISLAAFVALVYFILTHSGWRHS